MQGAGTIYTLCLPRILENHDIKQKPDICFSGVKLMELKKMTILTISTIKICGISTLVKTSNVIFCTVLTIQDDCSKTIIIVKDDRQ